MTCVDVAIMLGIVALTLVLVLLAVVYPAVHDVSETKDPPLEDSEP